MTKAVMPKLTLFTWLDLPRQIGAANSSVNVYSSRPTLAPSYACALPRNTSAS